VNAQSVEPRDAQLGPDGQAVEPDDLPPAPASHGTCFSWTVSRGFVGNTATQINVPTTARGNNQRHCLLRQGNNTDGVFKLQDAINRCYPQFSSGVGSDGNYGRNTVRAVRQIQGAVGVSVDGAYGPETKTAMNWPAYRQDNGNFHRCVLLRSS
jgi:hypothetical protein